MSMTAARYCLRRDRRCVPDRSVLLGGSTRINQDILSCCLPSMFRLGYPPPRGTLLREQVLRRQVRAYRASQCAHVGTSEAPRGRSQHPRGTVCLPFIASHRNSHYSNDGSAACSCSSSSSKDRDNVEAEVKTPSEGQEGRQLLSRGHILTSPGHEHAFALTSSNSIYTQWRLGVNPPLLLYDADYRAATTTIVDFALYGHRHDGRRGTLTAFPA